MEIRNAADMRERAERIGQGCLLTQLHPAGPMGSAMQVVDLLEIEPGGFTPLSAHAEEHVMFVIAGTGELTGAVGGGPTVVLHSDSVVHVGHREVHQIRNSGSELLRVLVSTPLVVRSERALGLPSAVEPRATEKEASAPTVSEVEPRPSPAARVAERPRAPEAEPAAEQPASVPADGRQAPVETEAEAEAEQPAPDISGLVKRASEVAASPKPERRRPTPAPAPEPEPEPVAAGQEAPQVEEVEGVEEEAPSSLMELNVVFDGGSRGNPGKGYGSYSVQTGSRNPVVKHVEFGDNYTNNQAEYDSLIAALEYIIERLEATNRTPGQVALDIKSDSDLVVNQLNGTFKVKDAGLKTRYAKALDLLDRFGAWIISWHPRDESVRLLGH